MRNITHSWSGMNRREFLSAAGKYALAGSLSVAFGSVLNGCVQPSKENIQKDLELGRKTQWDANPIIPVPKNGCYTGFWIRTADSVDSYQITLNEAKKRTGYEPAISLLGQSGTAAAYDDVFPFESAKEAVRNGIIPAMHYTVITRDMQEIVDGKHDNVIQSFAKKVKDFGHPFFFIPYKEINRGQVGWAEFLHSGTPPSVFKGAWRRMHKIFEINGANKNAVWSVHFIQKKLSTQHGTRPYEGYYPGDEFVDWIEFTVAALPYMGSTNESFRSIFSSEYKQVRKYYGNKPIGLWEFCAQNNSNQHRWITETFASFKNEFPAIKAFTWYSFHMDNGRASTIITDQGRAAYRNSIADPYFVKGPS